MEIQLQINLPGNPRAKGSVEVAQNIVETHFESLLRFQPVTHVDALNEAAAAWCNAFNANLVPDYDSRLHRVGMTAPMARSDLWLKIKPEQLRLCPPLPVCGALMRGASVQREVTAKLQIRYRHPQATVTRTYDLRHIRALNSGDTVTVRPLIYSNGAVMVEFDRYDGTKLNYRLEPVLDYDEAGQRLDAPVIGQEYKSLPKTDAERDGERLDALAYGVDGDGVIRDRQAIEKAKNNTTVAPFAHWCDGHGLRPLDALQGIQMPNYLPKKGVALTPKVAEVKPLDSLALEADGSALSVPSSVQLDQDALRLTHLEMAQRLAAALTDNWSAALYEQMVELYPNGVVYEEMPTVIDRFKRQVLAGQMRVINGGAAA
ncbi:MAG: hypothetical protein JNM52_07675, partial [Betaproteobacteria bacterium]|nr:hypothetical protein [Betaproteobacteria bacterium]